MIRAVIIDDENKARNNLLTLISLHVPDIEIIGMEGNVKKGAALVRSTLPDLLFLDIEMPDGSGLDLMARIEDIPVKVIFTTGFFIDCFDAYLIDEPNFLCKPIFPDDLVKAVEKVKAQICSEKDLNNDMYTWSFGDLKFKVPLRKIIKRVELKKVMYCKGGRRKCYLKLEKDTKVKSSLSIDEMDERLTNQMFIRVHERFLVNIKKVDHFEEYKKNLILVLKDNTIIPVEYYSKDELAKYMEMFLPAS